VADESRARRAAAELARALPADARRSRVAADADAGYHLPGSRIRRPV
jgi:hypothetical protein